MQKNVPVETILGSGYAIAGMIGSREWFLPALYLWLIIIII